MICGAGMLNAPMMSYTGVPRGMAEDGRAVLEAMFAAHESAAAGKRIDFPYQPAYPSRPIESWLRARGGL
jgi:hypothetical protein